MGFIPETGGGSGGGGSPSGPAGGDLTGTYPNPVLTTTGVSASTYGDSLNVSQITVNSKGRITSASNVPIPTALPPNGSAGGDLSGTYPNPTISNLARSKVANGTANHVLVNDGSGGLSSEAALAVSRGGVGVGTIPTNGQIPIGNGTGYVVSNITAGTGISIVNGPGGITINNLVLTSIVGYIDGGNASSVYGGITPLDGGNA